MFLIETAHFDDVIGPAQTLECLLRVRDIVPELCHWIIGSAEHGKLMAVHIPFRLHLKRRKEIVKKAR